MDKASPIFWHHVLGHLPLMGFAFAWVSLLLAWQRRDELSREHALWGLLLMVGLSIVAYRSGLGKAPEHTSWALWALISALVSGACAVWALIEAYRHHAIPPNPWRATVILTLVTVGVHLMAVFSGVQATLK